jgi:hypothetical protein
VRGDIIKDKKVRLKLKKKLLDHINSITSEGTVLDWEVLPPDQYDINKIKQYYNDDRCAVPKYDFSRLTILYAIKPIRIWRGKGEFRMYHVFEFANTCTAVLECPLVGNAIYLIKKDWIKLCKLSKMKLLENHSENVVRLTHHNITKDKIKMYLF